MALYYYYVNFAISLVLLLVYCYIFHKHFDVNLTIMAILGPLVCLSFLFIATSTTIEEALVGQRLSYVGGCFLLVAVMFLIFDVCGIPLKPWMRTLIIAISCIVFACGLTIGHLDIFYIGMPKLEIHNGAAYITDKKYGFMHTIFYIVVGIYYALTIGVLIYSFFKKRQVPRTILILIVLAVTIAMVGFFGGRLIIRDIELLPATSNLGIIIYFIMASRLRLYDASDSVTDSLVQKGDTGFISFDSKMRYLGCNQTAMKMIPELANLDIDHPVKDPWLEEHFLPLAERFQLDEANNQAHIQKGDRVYLISINRLIVGRFRRGYQFLLSDDTVNQEHLRLMKNYQSELEEEVARKTAHILKMQEKLVLGMATMVESRDNSTGGHIKRTSDGVHFLVEAMQKANYPGMDEEFCACLIKAAPMHDLGKIAVDDKILRKPGRFTPEEFEEMKKHSSEGARIVEAILNDTDDLRFKEIAVNVAHYHHERYDGSGYPCGLKGEDIPLEARIMAIADVYDALVSKRVYKDSLSFAEADKIITSGMGTQFDPKLERFYIEARPRLEAYYQTLSNQ